MSLMIEGRKCSSLLMENGKTKWESREVFKTFCSAESRSVSILCVGTREIQRIENDQSEMFYAWRKLLISMF